MLTRIPILNILSTHASCFIWKEYQVKILQFGIKHAD